MIEKKIEIEADINSDGIPDMKAIIELPQDWRFWAVVAAVIGIIVGAKELGVW